MSGVSPRWESTVPYRDPRTSEHGVFRVVIESNEAREATDRGLAAAVRTSVSASRCSRTTDAAELHVSVRARLDHRDGAPTDVRATRSAAASVRSRAASA